MPDPGSGRIRTFTPPIGDERSLAGEGKGAQRTQTTRTSVHPWVAEGTRHARFGIDVNVLPDWPAIRDFAQTIEGLGFDSVWLPDHPMGTNNATWTSLAAMAAATENIRLGTLVACASYWNPVVLARAAADIDRLSGGRFVLGLGSGDMPHEFGQMGLDWQPAPQRQATLDEALHIIPPLLRGETVDYDGERLHANGAALNPPPVQQPHVPILVAGGGEQTTLRYVADTPTPATSAPSPGPAEPLPRTTSSTSSTACVATWRRSSDPTTPFCAPAC